MGSVLTVPINGCLLLPPCNASKPNYTEKPDQGTFDSDSAQGFLFMANVKRDSKCPFLF